MKKAFGPQENGVSQTNGDLLTDKAKILKRWKEHTVLNNTSSIDEDVLESTTRNT